MLVAWHKFDAYERNVLVEVTGIPLNKLPFIPIIQVCRILRRRFEDMTYTHWKKRGEHAWFPAGEYTMRIERAAMKEHRKRHRKRERLKV